MDSFYGGRPGVSPVIKATFKYVTNLYQNGSAMDKILRKDWNKASSSEKLELQKQTMVWIPNTGHWSGEDNKPHNLADNLYRDVWFDELCIIDANSKNNINNGKVYRRTLKSDGTSTELGGYAEYIGQLNGPAGVTPIITLAGLSKNESDLRTLQSAHNNTNEHGEGYFRNDSGNVDPDGYLAQDQSLYIYNTSNNQAVNRIGLVLGNEDIGTTATEYPQGLRYNWYNYKYSDVVGDDATHLDVLRYGIGLEVPIVFPEIVGGAALDFTQDPAIEGEQVENAPFYYRYTAKIPRGIPGGFITKIHKVTYKGPEENANSYARRPRDAGSGAGSINYPAGNYYHTLDDIEYYISEDVTAAGYPKFSGYRIKMYARETANNNIVDNSQSCPMPFDNIWSGHTLYRVQGMNLKNFVYGHQTTKNKNTFIAKYPNLLSESMQEDDDFTISNDAELWVCEFHYLDRFGHEIAVSDQYSESAAGFTGDSLPRFYSYEDINGHPGLRRLTEEAPAEFVLGFVSDIKDIIEIKDNDGIVHGITIVYSTGITKDYYWPVFKNLSLVGDVTLSNIDSSRKIKYTYYNKNGATATTSIGSEINYIQELVTSPIGNDWKLVEWKNGVRQDIKQDAIPSFIEPYHLLALYTAYGKRDEIATKTGTWCYNVAGNTVSASPDIYWKDLGRVRGVDKGITVDVVLTSAELNGASTAAAVAQKLNTKYQNGYINERYGSVVAVRIPEQNNSGATLTHFFAWNANSAKWEDVGTIESVMVPATIWQQATSNEPSHGYWTAPAEDTLILRSIPIPNITTTANKFISKPWKSS